MLAFRQYHLMAHDVLLGEVRGRLASACGDMGICFLLPVHIDTNALGLEPQIEPQTNPPRSGNAISRLGRSVWVNQGRK